MLTHLGQVISHSLQWKESKCPGGGGRGQPNIWKSGRRGVETLRTEVLEGGTRQGDESSSGSLPRLSRPWHFQFVQIDRQPERLFSALPVCGEAHAQTVVCYDEWAKCQGLETQLRSSITTLHLVFCLFSHVTNSPLSSQCGFVMLETFSVKELNSRVMFLIWRFLIVRFQSLYTPPNQKLYKSNTMVQLVRLKCVSCTRGQSRAERLYLEFPSGPKSQCSQQQSSLRLGTFTWLSAFYYWSC